MGATFRVPADTIGFAPYPGGSWAYTTPSDRTAASIHVPGHPTPLASPVGNYAVTPDGGSLAYLVTSDGTPHLVLVGTHARVWAVAAPARTVAGILPGGDVVYNDRNRASIKIAHQDGTITTLDYRYALAVSSVTGAIAAETAGPAPRTTHRGPSAPAP